MNTSISTEEVVTAMELTAEQNNGLFTLVDVAKMFMEPGTSKAPRNTHQYSRAWRVATKLTKAKMLVKNEDGTFSIPTPLDRANIAKLCPNWEERKKLMKNIPEEAGPEIPSPTVQAYQTAVKALTEPDTSAPPERVLPQLKPLLMEEVLQALEKICIKPDMGMGIGYRELTDKCFPAESPERVRAYLKYLEDTGKVVRSQDPNNKLKKLFRPAWMIAKKPVVVEIPKPVKVKALAFLCDVCSALIGVKAQEGIHCVTCTGCQEEFMVRTGWAYRLSSGIQLKVWVPE